jgi:hypothetical protein
MRPRQRRTKSSEVYKPVPRPSIGLISGYLTRCKRTQAPVDTVETAPAESLYRPPSSNLCGPTLTYGRSQRTGRPTPPAMRPLAPPSAINLSAKNTRGSLKDLPRGQLSGERCSPNSHRSTICSRLPLDSYAGNREFERADGPSRVSLSPNGRGYGRSPNAAYLETTFPIFNRKLGVCGRCIASFCTFSTPVDDAVDNWVVSPAKRSSLPTAQHAFHHVTETEEPLFPGFVCQQGCGKTPSASLQWRRAFGTRRAAHTRTRSRPPPSDDQPQIFPQ